jgi:hypothetical protein
MLLARRATRALQENLRAWRVASSNVFSEKRDVFRVAAGGCRAHRRPEADARTHAKYGNVGVRIQVY